MGDVLKNFDFLLKEDGPAAIVLKQWLKPVGGDIIFPPTYAAPSQKKGDPPVYNIDRFGESSILRKTFEKLGKVQTFIDAERTEQGREHSVCIVDSIPSQANRIEPAFAHAVADGRLVPQVVIKVEIKNDAGKKEEQVINLLDAGHRAADAIVRFSSLADELGRAIRARRDGDSLPLAKIAPTSLVFGMWDSRATGVKVPRLVNSIIRAYDVFEYRRSAQYFSAADYEAAGVAAEKGEGSLKKLADEGMAEVPATFGLGGIEARGGICRDASLNLVTLRDIVTIVRENSGQQAETDQEKSREETLKLQRYLLGLGLVSLTWFDSKTLNLRQGCQLVAVPGKPMTRVCINADGSEADFQIERASAVEYAKKTAEAFGVIGGYEATFDPGKAKDALKRKSAND
ncbi:MAG: type I-G CRISPR-associated RAMP protein Csb1/Cas7g [Candidatus Binataceae bacterium]